MTDLVLAEEVMKPQGRPYGHFWDRQGMHGLWWLADGSPGALGDAEIWIDESAMDMYGRGDAAPAVAVTPEPGKAHMAVPWIGACIRFARHGNDLGDPVVYQVISRRFSQDNSGRPYYVARWPD